MIVWASAGIRCCRWMIGPYASPTSVPHLSRSALHRCLQTPRHLTLTGWSRATKPKRQISNCYPMAIFHIDIAEVQTAEGKLYSLVGIDRPASCSHPCSGKGQIANSVAIPRKSAQGCALSHPYDSSLIMVIQVAETAPATGTLHIHGRCVSTVTPIDYRAYCSLHVMRSHRHPVHGSAGSSKRLIL